MRKKSHICLARYIVRNMQQEDLLEHRYDFYLGSILPDCKPSFITTKHQISGTFHMVAKDIKRLSEVKVVNEYNMHTYYRDLGQIIHYIADYFTFPHNEHYDGTLKDHCIYEEHLKKNLREYIKSEGPALNQHRVREFRSAEEICEFISYSHSSYMKINTNVDEDCKYIVALCCQVVEGLLQLLHITSPGLLLKAV